MFVAKQAADLITFSRGLLGLGLVWLGFVQGAEGLPVAVWAMILDWTGDSLDGVIARRSRIIYRSWIGDHDIQVDILVSIGLMGYMLASGFVGLNLVIIYVLLWLVIFWRWGVDPALEMLFQAPIYGWFIWVAVRSAPTAGWWFVVWIVMAVILTWPKFPRVILPGFIEGMQRALSLGHKGQHTKGNQGKTA